MIYSVRPVGDLQNMKGSSRNFLGNLNKKAARPANSLKINDQI